MYKPLRLLAAGMLCALLAVPACASAADFSASGLTVSGSAQQLGAPASYGSKTVSTVTIPAENPVISGVNPLTGEAFSGSYQPTLVSIDAHPSALPHWGVSSADLMYEMPIQRDGSTRSIAVFMSDYPESADPVRSARVAMCSLREMWGGILCFYGYQGGNDTNNVLNWVKANSAEKTLSYPYYLNGITKYASWFTRSNDQNHVSPHNVRLNLTEVRNDYTQTPTPHPFLFSDTGLDHGEDVNGLIISYKTTSPAYVSAYQYNPTTGLYDRYRNGTAYIDGDTGEQCAYANVIVLRTDITWASNNNSRPVIRLNGEGVCEIFQNGKYIRGTWARDCTETSGLQNRMVFFDDNGNELALKVGKTFIQIVDNEQPVVVLADGAISGAVEPQEQRLTIGSGAASGTSVSAKATRTPKPTRTPKATDSPTPAPTNTPTPEPTATPTPTPEPQQPVEPDTSNEGGNSDSEGGNEGSTGGDSTGGEGSGSGNEGNGSGEGTGGDSSSSNEGSGDSTGGNDNSSSGNEGGGSSEGSSAGSDNGNSESTSGNESSGGNNNETPTETTNKESESTTSVSEPAEIPDDNGEA